MLERGISSARVASWIRRGRLHPLYPGVYAWGRRDLSTAGELAAALLCAGPGACLTSLTALWCRAFSGSGPVRST